MKKEVLVVFIKQETCELRRVTSFPKPTFLIKKISAAPVPALFPHRVPVSGFSGPQV